MKASHSNGKRRKEQCNGVDSAEYLAPAYDSVDDAEHKCDDEVCKDEHPIFSSACPSAEVSVLPEHFKIPFFKFHDVWILSVVNNRVVINGFCFRIYNHVIRYRKNINIMIKLQILSEFSCMEKPARLQMPVYALLVPECAELFVAAFSMEIMP